MQSDHVLRLAACALAIGCATNPAGKRPAPPARSSIGCLDTLHATDSVWSVVKLSVSPADTTKILPNDFESLFTQEFRRKFRVPGKLPLSVVMGTQPCDSLGSRCAGGLLDLAAVAFATAHYDGKLTGIEVIDATLTPTLADSVGATLAAMSREGLVPTETADSIPLVVRMETEENPDTVPDVRHVFRARVPRYTLPFRYATMPAAGVDPRYPFTARLAGVGDSVAVAFTVDAEGWIAPESLELLRASYRDFVASVLTTLQQTRYHPARLGDCPVSTRMSQRFLFKASKE